MKDNMVTAQLVKAYVTKNAFLLDYLSRDLINVASLARELLPMIKKENPKATVESISIAIKRLDLSKQAISKQLHEVLSGIQITLRTDVKLICLRKGTTLPDISKFKGDDLFYVNQGADEVTVILDKKNDELIKGARILDKPSLAAISLKDTRVSQKSNYRITPGFVNLFLNAISREGINIEDIISTYSQVTFVVDKSAALDVFRLCESVKSQKFF